MLCECFPLFRYLDDVVYIEFTQRFCGIVCVSHWWCCWFHYSGTSYPVLGCLLFQQFVHKTYNVIHLSSSTKSENINNMHENGKMKKKSTKNLYENCFILYSTFSFLLLAIAYPLYASLSVCVCNVICR